MSIHADEEAEHRKMWAYARHSLWLEGFTLDAEDEELFESWVRGEITRTELNAAVRARAGETPPEGAR